MIIRDSKFSMLKRGMTNLYHTDAKQHIFKGILKDIYSKYFDKLNLISWLFIC